MQLLPHQQRVVDEKKELDDKRRKLTAFLNDPNFDKIVQDWDEQNRLARQEAVMADYSSILEARINNFK